MDKLWSKSEIADLQQNASSQSEEELARRFDTDTVTIHHKLGELGLSSGLSLNTEVIDDPSLGHFAEGMGLLGSKDHAGAASLFEKVIEETDGRHLRDRARQFLDICRQHIATTEPIDNPYLSAVYEKNRGNLDKAMEFCEQSSADDERFVYLKASIKVLADEEESALEYLERSIALEPKNRVYAFHDPDFDSLRGTEGFTALIKPPKAEAAS